MVKDELTAEGIKFRAYIPDSETDSVIYTCLEEETVLTVMDLMDCRAVIVSFECDWNRDLSPWKASKVFRGEEDFSGGADEFIKRLEKAVPYIEKTEKIEGKTRIIAGYSMAGLFSLYAVYKTELFEKAGSISGSLWFDGFEEYVTNGLNKPFVSKIYLSLGDREASSRNNRICKVKIVTENIYSYLNTNVCDTVYTLNPGGHFDGIPRRISRAFQELLH